MKKVKLIIFSFLLMLLAGCNNQNINTTTSTNTPLNIDITSYLEYEIIDDSASEYVKIISCPDIFAKKIIIPNETTINGKTYPIIEIANETFKYCSSLESITLPFVGRSKDSNRYLGYIFGASSYSDNSQYVPSSLKEVIIFNGYTSIGSCAFWGCSSLTSVVIPNSVIAIGSNAFYECSSLESITLPFVGGSRDNNQHLGYIFGASLYIYNSSYVPSSLKEVIILEGCTTIGDYAFYGCSSLTKITIPSSVTTIGYNAFNGCSSLTNIVIPNSVTSIGRYAFNGCSSLTNIVIPNSVTSIGRYAFNGCSSLESITLPFVGRSRNSKKYLGYIFGASSYENNSKFVPSSLKEVIILEGCTTIGYGAFYGCRFLTSVVIPSSVTTIGEYAFYGCSSLTSVVIPSSVTTIGDYAFYDCYSLTIYCEVSSQLSGWSSYWNSSNRPVYWNYLEDFLMYVNKRYVLVGKRV